MKMKWRVLLVTGGSVFLFAALLSLAIVLNEALDSNMAFPLMGDGVAAHSPDGRYIADASSYSHKRLLGMKREYFVFSILESSGKTIIQRVVMALPGAEPKFSLRHNASVKWAEDSLSVQFRYRTVGGPVVLSMDVKTDGSATVRK